MGNRKLYLQKSFIVTGIERYDKGDLWHLIGKFTQGSIITKYDREFRVRVKPDERWNEAVVVIFHADSIYECESIRWTSRRHTYGSGNWYISPYRATSGRQEKDRFEFEDIQVSTSH